MCIQKNCYRRDSRQDETEAKKALDNWTNNEAADFTSVGLDKEEAVNIF